MFLWEFSARHHIQWRWNWKWLYCVAVVNSIRRSLHVTSKVYVATSLVVRRLVVWGCLCKSLTGLLSFECRMSNVLLTRTGCYTVSLSNVNSRACYHTNGLVWVQGNPYLSLHFPHFYSVFWYLLHFPFSLSYSLYLFFAFPSLFILPVLSRSIFQARCLKRQLSLVLVFVCWFCVICILLVKDAWLFSSYLI